LRVDEVPASPFGYVLSSKHTADGPARLGEHGVKRVDDLDGLIPTALH
jgi:hypothetical protein